MQGTSFLEQLHHPLHPLLYPHTMVYSLGRVASLLLGSRYASKLSQPILLVQDFLLLLVSSNFNLSHNNIVPNALGEIVM